MMRPHPGQNIGRGKAVQLQAFPGQANGGVLIWNTSGTMAAVQKSARSDPRNGRESC